MRNESNVNVHQRATRAAERTDNGSRYLQEVLDAPQLPLWERIWSHLVVTKADGKYTISQPLALVLIGILGTAFFAYYWRTSDIHESQREQIIILRTQLASEKEKNIDQDSKIDQARNYATIADKNQARLEGKFDQFALQYGIKNAGKPVNGGNQ